MRTITHSQEGHLTAIIADTPLEQMRLYELIKEEQRNVDDLARGLKIRTSSQWIDTTLDATRAQVMNVFK